MYYDKTNESYENILNKIALDLETKLNIRKNYYIIRIENQKTVNNLINYLDKYQLLSSKYLDYLIWKDVYSIILSKKHMTFENRELILKLKNSMNNKRSNFQWDHIKNIHI